jgi:hypothetical protein
MYSRKNWYPESCMVWSRYVRADCRVHELSSSDYSSGSEEVGRALG